jgi:hypothetical protein
MSDREEMDHKDKIAAKKAAVMGTQKSKKSLLFSITAVVIVAGAFTWFGIKNVSGKSREVVEDGFVGVSAVKNRPDLYLGDITVKGVAKRVLNNQGVIEISDEKACCSIYLLTPTRVEQLPELNISELYDGRYPSVGAQITASGTLKKENEGYRFIVSELQQGGHTLMTKQ